MSETKHMPLPWAIEDRYFIVDSSGNDVCHSVNADAKHDEANAEFIVRACNAFDELLAACEEADILFAHGVASQNEFVREHNINAAKEIMARIQAVIIKAKGGAE